jgi:hypothetical protein
MGRKICVLFFLLSTIGWAQTIGGSWTGELAVVPVLSLTSTSFELYFEFVDGWTLTSRSDFLGADGWVWQEVGLKGSLGFAEVEFTTVFGPKAPAFLYAMARASASIEGVDIDLYAASVGPDTASYFSGGPSGGMVAVVATDLDGVSLRGEIGIGARLTDPWAPFTITYSGLDTYTKDFLIDPFPGGLEFTYFQLTLEGLSICCGVSFDLEFSFTKWDGFEYIKFFVADLFQLCCGTEVDLSVTFATNAKSISVEPHWAGLEGCVQVFGDVQFADSLLGGLELYGFRILCELQECYSIEVLTAFRPDLFYVVDDELLVAPAHVPYQAEPLFDRNEFEYVKLSACGAACCGGTWTLDIWAFFRETSGTLFGLSRIFVEMEIPLLTNFSVASTLEVAIPGGPSLSIGWAFTF